jgi:flagellum-specific ATP synthase
MNFEQIHNRLENIDTFIKYGNIDKVAGLVVESTGPECTIGEVCDIVSSGKKRIFSAEVVGFSGKKILTMPLENLSGIGPGDKVVAKGKLPVVKVGKALLGRVVNGLGEPLDNKGPIEYETSYPVYNKPVNPLERKKISSVLKTGIKIIDSTLTCAKGQRVGIFAGSGVGKSTMLGMLARNTEADINVISLVGERGREVSAFIEDDLGEEGMARSVVVVSTSDQPPLIRLRAALTATAIAEFFKDKGADVMLMMDSVTRFAMAGREIGLAAGEPPSSKGYTPSVFAMLPRLLERAGSFKTGSITGFYTVLVEGDDMNDPIADSVRSILDGHIVLSRKLAAANRYPAIDILQSISRLMESVAPLELKQLAGMVRDIISTYTDSEDLINIGAYKEGSNPDIDKAIKYYPKIVEFFRQKIGEKSDFDNMLKELREILS